MQTLTPTLAAAYKARTQYPVTVIDVIPKGGTFTTPALATLKIKDASADLDQSRPVRRNLGGMTVPIGGPNDALVPKKPGDLLHTATANELRVSYGRNTGSPPGTGPELLPFGIYGYDKPLVVDDGTDLLLTMTGQDRAASIQRNRWTEPLQIRGGALIPQAIRTIAEDRWPSKAIPLEVDFTACAGHPIMSMTCPNAVYGSDHTAADPWADLTTLAAVGGCLIYFGPDGRLYVVPYVDPDLALPVATYTDKADATVTDVRPTPTVAVTGPGNRAMAKIQRALDIGKVYNGIVVTGGNSNDPACRAEWWDRNPESPTYVETYGKVPAFFDNPLIRNQGQAQIVAAAFGTRLHVGAEVLTLEAVPVGMYEGSDALQVSRPAIMDTTKYLLEKQNVDLGEAPKPMTITSASTTSREGVTIT